MPWTITRQSQWPEGTPVVEISYGGLDYTNPDALVAKYPGEFEVFEDPREAVETAIAICKRWQADGERKARIGVGATGGMTMPFSPCTFAEARRWAKERYRRLPKCSRCGELLPEKHYTVPELDDEQFCREYCAEEAYREACADDEDAVCVQGSGPQSGTSGSRRPSTPWSSSTAIP